MILKQLDSRVISPFGFASWAIDPSPRGLTVKKSSTCLNYVFVGRKYNKDGDLVNWWTNSSNEAFEKKSQCFIKQYSSFEAYGKKVRNFTNTVCGLKANLTSVELSVK